MKKYYYSVKTIVQVLKPFIMIITVSTVYVSSTFAAKSSMSAKTIVVLRLHLTII